MHKIKICLFVSFVPFCGYLSVINMCVRIYYSDYRAVGRRIVPFEGERRLFASAPKNKFALAGSDRIEGDSRLAFRFQVGIERLYDKEFAPIERFIFYRGYDSSDYAGDLHKEFIESVEFNEFVEIDDFLNKLKEP